MEFEKDRLNSLLHIALLLNLLQKEDLDNWVLETIEKVSYNDSLYSLYAAKNLNEVLDVLGVIPNDEVSVLYFIDFFLGFFRVSFKNEIWREIEEKIVAFFKVIDISNVDQVLRAQFIRINDDYELRHDGFIGSMDMPIDLLIFLDTFSSSSTNHEILDGLKFPKMRIH